MSKFSPVKRRARLVKRNRNRKGAQLQKAEGLYDIDTLSRSIGKGPADKTAYSLSKSIQAKLQIGSPDDTYEKEADRTADKIVKATESAATGSKLQKQEDEVQTKPLLQKQEEEEVQTKPLLQKQEEEEEAQAKSLLQKQQEEEEEAQAKSLLQKQEEEEEEMQTKPLLQKQEEEEEEMQTKPLLQKQEEEEEEMQTKPLLQKQEEEEEAQPKVPKGETSFSKAVSPATADRISSRRGMGEKMGRQTQNLMESQFNRDFSGVHIHTDKEANEISQRLKAQAFTLGKDIYFGSGKYDPDSREGKHLLAHELTHVVQQNQTKKKT